MEDDIDLREYLSVLWRRRYLIVAVTLAAAIVALLPGFLRPPVYESEAVIQLSEQSAPAYATPSSAAQILTSPSFLGAAVGGAGPPPSARSLRGQIRVELVRDARMIRLKVRHTNPALAGELADRITRAFIAGASERVEQKRRVVQERLDAVNGQLIEVQRILALTRVTLARLQQGSALTGEERGFVGSFTLNAMSVSESLYLELQAAHRDLSAELLTLEPPSLIGSPSAPTEPVAPRRLANILLAGVLGLMAGSLLAFTLEYLVPSAARPRAVIAAPPETGPKGA